jgi:hypothetical protein
LYRHADGTEQSEHPGRAEALLVLTQALVGSSLVTVNLLGNDIRAADAETLVEVMRGGELRSLCGLSGEETEVDMRRKSLTEGCALMLANEINASIVSLDLSENRIGSEGVDYIASALERNVSSHSI